VEEEVKSAFELAMERISGLPKLTPEELKVIVDTAHEHGLPVSGHITSGAYVMTLLAAGVDDIAHGPLDYLPDDGVLVPCYHRPADWRIGRGAGPKRNKEMLAELLKFPGDRLVVAFHDDLKSSKGTANMVAIATKAGVHVRLIKHGEDE